MRNLPYLFRWGEYTNKINHLQGEESPCYKTGIGKFFRYRKSLHNIEKHCHRCGKDLTNANRYEWVVHHKDHNRQHNTVDNFEILCKSCHQLEHKCGAALQRDYTKNCVICGAIFISKANNAKYCPMCNKIYRRWKHRFTVDFIKQKVNEYGKERVTTIPKGSTLK